MANQATPVQITVIPAEPGWSMVFGMRPATAAEHWPVLAWQIRSFEKGVVDVRPVTVEEMINAGHASLGRDVYGYLLRDPQGVFRLTCGAFESKLIFATEDEARAYLQQSTRTRAGYDDEVGEPQSAA
jgi:hypothetical protein